MGMAGVVGDTTKALWDSVAPMVDEEEIEHNVAEVMVLVVAVEYKAGEAFEAGAAIEAGDALGAEVAFKAAEVVVKAGVVFKAATHHIHHKW